MAKDQRRWRLIKDFKKGKFCFLIEESITLELENPPWYIELEGNKNEWNLRFVFESQDQSRSFEMYWPIPIAQSLFNEIKKMWESTD